MLTFPELNRLIEDEIRKINLGHHPVELYEPIRYSIDTGGKRIRPVFVLASYNLFSDAIENAMPAALAIEVFHNFTLLHDDIMDKALLRRNKPTVHVKWNENVAILSGDAMLIKAYDLLVKSPEGSLRKIFELFNKTAAEVCEGQQLDMNFEKRFDVSEEEYLEMIRLKTSVLLAASSKMGALCADSNEKIAEKMYEFGLNLGLAFQLQDDYLDSFGKAEKFGKKIGGDIVANKKTYLLVKSLETASQKERSVLLEMLNQQQVNESEKIKIVTAIYNNLDIPEMVGKKMQMYYKKAMDALNAVDVNQSRKTILIDFANKLMVRDS